MGYVELIAVVDDFCAQIFHRLELPRVRLIRHDDRHRRVEGLPGEGHRLTVVSGGGSYEAAGEFPGLKLRDKVDAAAWLEGSEYLVVLVLDPQFGVRPDETAKRRVLPERGPVHVRGDPAAGVDHVPEVGRLKQKSPSGVDPRVVCGDAPAERIIRLYRPVGIPQRKRTSLRISFKP